MSFAITNSRNVQVLNWSVIQPQFWASIVINSTDVLYKDYYVNATQYNPEGTGAFLSWLQNTDGCDTYRSHNVTFGEQWPRSQGELANGNREYGVPRRR
jgi:polygalacturonase